ncbi:MAG: hypothetical protein Q9195_006199 [Heterodermia aff. obscurata]
MSQPSHLPKLIAFILAFLPTALGAQSSGPTAPVSISDTPAYTTARPCAAGCLWDNTDIWTCGVNAGWYDVAQELQCGCDALNACYCAKDNAASASSYLSSCVSSACSNFPQETSSAIDLYNDYCATANVAVAVETTSDTTSPAVAASSSTTTASPRRTIQTTTASSSGQGAAAPTSSSDLPDGKGALSRSDVIALGVGLGVGIPSLMIAVATFCLMRKKGNNNRRSVAALPPHNSYREIYR